ncbi:hypothetical protein F5880DRAFT_1537856 [Lentinula raphanica]|nr:hypothetical protein F5880DRAFT_1537856 [Lentinula raphanica]
MCNESDLSKVALRRTRSYQVISPEYKKYLNQGMRILCLELVEDDSFVTQLDSKALPGIQEFQFLILGFSDSNPLSWLPVLSSNHPTLNELWLLGGRKRYFDHVALPFLSPFIIESQRQNLDGFFLIKKMGIHRSIGSYSQEWYVRGLSLRTTSASISLIEILTLVASSFPKLEMLTLKLGQHEEKYHINDLASAFARFSSLRVLYLEKVFDRLKTEIETLTPLLQRRSTPIALDDLRDDVKSRLLLFASHLARHVRTLDSIHIDEAGYEYDNAAGVSLGNWYLSGWLHVLNGNRDIGGILA